MDTGFWRILKIKQVRKVSYFNKKLFTLKFLTKYINSIYAWFENFV